MGGIGHFTSGINSAPNSAWTSNGRLVIPIVNASQVTTGTLSANNGTSWLDLDAGSGSFGNGALTWSQSGNLTANNMTASNINITSGQVKIGGGTYYTQISNGSIGQHLGSSGALVGGVVPIGTGSTLYQGIYAANVRHGVGIYHQDAQGSFDELATFSRTGNKLSQNTEVQGNLSVSGTVTGDIPLQSVGKDAGSGLGRIALNAYYTSADGGGVTFEITVGGTPWRRLAMKSEKLDYFDGSVWHTIWQ
jgi:hypothetical protein